MPCRSLVLLVATTLAACQPDRPAPSANLDEIAREYVTLELGMGLHDENHVDAYFGPTELQSESERRKLSLDAIHDRAAVMAERLDHMREQGVEPEKDARIAGLLARLEALLARIAINHGETESFDDESRRLFGVSAPDFDTSHFEAILDEIDDLLPGEGSLSDRVNRFQDRFVIPPERLSAVFYAAIAECRRRTVAHIDLPAGESFRLEYVTGKPWSGYNWYQGKAHSLIQINTDLPVFIHRAVDLGCHEGYPGHHTFNVLLEQKLVGDKGWVEFSLYPLFSPQSLIAEGSGNYGIELAFPGDERVRFEKEVLFPLAGLNAADADAYYALLERLDQLSYAGNEAARDYLNGNIDREAAIQWLIDYALASPERARQRVDFFDTYRSYVINYNLGQDLVRHYIESGSGPATDRWQRFAGLLSSPMLPEDLR